MELAHSQNIGKGTFHVNLKHLSRDMLSYLFKQI